MGYNSDADIESLNLKNSSATKIVEHIPCGYSMSTLWSFDNIEIEHALYCREDCLKKSCTSLREHATNVINFGNKKNDVSVNKRRNKTIPSRKSMSYLWIKNLKKLC